MQRLFSFIFNYRVILIFISLEIFCFILIFSKNDYQKTTIINSSSVVSGNFLAKKRDISDYFHLSKQNERLAAENTKLKEQILKYNAQDARVNKSKNNELNKFYLHSAKVVNNSVHKQNNYITLNIGKKNGIKKGMGVVNEQGVIGIVVSTSSNYSLVASILHSRSMISSKIGKTNTVGTSVWPGKNTDIFELKYIPKHIKIEKMDTVVTSSFNAIFPENIPIGTIQNFKVEKSSSFYNIEIKLLPQISDLNFVYVIENRLKVEQQQLESTIPND